MQRIYLDNAATTAVDPLVLSEMLPYFTEKFGNASSIHSYGRETRMAIEKSRKSIASWMNCKPGEIFFTSCGTESSNTAITAAIRDLGCTHIITTRIEHHATLHTVEFYEKLGLCNVSYIDLLPNGHIDKEHLTRLLEENKDTCLVSLMHANNEIGNLLDLSFVAQLCDKFKVYFHTDAVQTVAHYPFNLQAFPIHFLSASGHKFHGPKGIGFLYINHQVHIKPLLHGGAQERMMRAGTENVANIVGIGKALDLAMTNLVQDQAHILSLKRYLKEKLLALPEVTINGDEGDQSLFTVLNVSFPKNPKTEVLSMNLDVNGICISGGSACSSGAEGGSHVIKAVYPELTCVPIRFSFSKHNTLAELDIVVAKIEQLLQA